MLEFNNFEAIEIGLASPEKVRGLSKGEVKKPETINYRTLKPEKDGLFCERIFGPTKDWECHCGKYKRIRYKGIFCDRCGVEVTRAKVRRERMGHIELAAPVSHIWYFKGIPSRMGLILNMSPRQLEKVLYFAAYVVIDPGKTKLQKKEVITETVYRENIEKYGVGKFRAGMGAEAIKELLSELDLETMATELRAELIDAQGQKKARAVKVLEVVEAFRTSGNKPEWMVLEVVPVIPPEIRPMVQLDGGRFATSDLNDLYRRVINRNNRLKRLLDLGAPDIIVRNEKRMLQEAVDALIDNGRRGKPVTGPGNRPLKSLSDMLKGKQGRFRQNLLGKRVDYSGRSVIVVGPELKIYQCGLPKEMALELFKPFVMKKLVNDGGAHNIKNAKKKVERADETVWDVLEEVIREHPVLLNRAPTLHRLGIQAFEPVLVEGRAIRLHPLVCTAYNADFDGDQMAVHVPLSPEAQAEARFLMLSANNLLKPQDGKPVTVPTQDMVLGSYYLTIAMGEKELTAAGDLVQKTDKLPVFETEKEALEAYNSREIGKFDELNILIKGKGAPKYRTTNILNIIIKNFDSANAVIEACEKDEIGPYEPVCIPDIGDETFGKKENGKVYTTYKHLTMRKFMNTHEAILAYENKVITLHEPIMVRVSRMVMGEMQYKIISATVGRLIFNENIPQDLGFVDRTNQSTMFDLEITFKATKAGLEKIIDRCINTHGLTKTAVLLDKIKTLGFKYSTKGAITVGVSDMEIPAAKPQYIAEAEDKIDKITAAYRRGLITEDGRYKAVIATWQSAVDHITKALMNNLDDFNPINMMSTSGARGNVGQMRQLAGIRGLMFDTTGKTIEIPIKASFREGLDVIEFFISTHGARKGLADTALRTADSGYLTRRLVDVSQEVIIREMDCETSKYILVRAIENEKPRDAGDTERYVIEPLSDRIKWRTAAEDIIHPTTGEIIVAKNQIISTGEAEKIHKVGIREVKIRSVITCRAKLGVCAKCYGSNLASGELVNVGEAVGIIAAQSIGEPGTQLTMRTFHSGGVAGDDITQGLPRVEELFEARKPPRGLAMIAEEGGRVSISDGKKGRVIIVTDTETGLAREYHISHNSTLKVKDEDIVESGQELTGGAINPSDLLRIKGANAVQEYIVREVQKVYKSQGVAINDKHIEVIIRQMLKKVRVEEAGATDLLVGSLIDRHRFEIILDEVATKGEQVPVCKDVLLGITKSSLATESFLSAASFQETTRVLTEAAIKGKRDPLIGLKENVIIGKLVPAGTGMDCYNNVDVQTITRQNL